MTKITNKYRTLRAYRVDIWGMLFAKIWNRGWKNSKGLWYKGKKRWWAVEKWRIDWKKIRRIKRVKKKFLKSIRPLQKAFDDSRRRRNWGNLLLLDSRRGSEYKRTRRRSLYGKMLIRRQCLRNFYGMMKEKQIKSITNRALKCYKSNIQVKGGPVYRLCRFLELRLDTLLWRARFGKSVRSVRQMILHNRVFVNGFCLNRPSYVLNIGDYINVEKQIVRSQIRKFKRFKMFPPVPNYLDVDYKNFTIYVTDHPYLNHLYYPFDGSINDLIAFYNAKYQS